MLTAFRDVQIPLLAAMLLGGCTAKLFRALRRHSIGAGLGPSALFPLRLRPWAAGTLCATELAMGSGLIVTATSIGAGPPATAIRVCTCLLFVVATCTLIELRSIRPDIGCGCFGDFSSTPITGRTLTRSVLLAAAALVTVGVPIVRFPQSFGRLVPTLILLLVELGILALLSPEVRDMLVRIGYSVPCELRVVSPDQTLAILRRSAQWRRHEALITDDQPLDVWRELCWRYLAFSGRYNGRDAEMVFAVYLQSRHPLVLSALVDAATGAVIPWPVNSGRPVSWRWARLLRRGVHAAPQPGLPAWVDELPARARGRLPVPGHGREPIPDHVAGQEPSHAAGSSAG